MVDLAELQTIAYTAQIVGVIGTLTAAFIAVRSYINANKRTQETRDRELETRQAQLFMQVYGRWNESSFSRHYTHFIFGLKWNNWAEFKERILENPNNFESMANVFRFFEGLGVLVRENLIDMRLIALTMSSDIRIYWEKMKPIVGDFRRDWNSPRLVDQSEFLYLELLKYMEKHPEFKT